MPCIFSVVMPLYNKAPHVARSISSVLRQSCDSWELLVVNDGSTDSSVEELGRFSDPRIRLIHAGHSSPRGPGVARNLGISEARGRWIAFLDADDEWTDAHLENLLQLSQSFPSAKFLSCAWEYRLGSKSLRDPYSLRYGGEGPHIISLRRYLDLSVEGIRPTCSNVACVENSPQVRSLFPEHPLAKRGEDLQAWLVLMCGLMSEMAWSPEVGAYYHRDSVNMLTKTMQASPFLMSGENFDFLSAKLNSNERLLLLRVFNRRLKSAWLGNHSRGSPSFFLPKHLFYKGDFQFAFMWAALSVLPGTLIKFLVLLKRKLPFTAISAAILNLVLLNFISIF